MCARVRVRARIPVRSSPSPFRRRHENTRFDPKPGVSATDDRPYPGRGEPRERRRAYRFLRTRRRREVRGETRERAVNRKRTRARRDDGGNRGNRLGTLPQPAAAVRAFRGASRPAVVVSVYGRGGDDGGGWLRRRGPRAAGVRRSRENDGGERIGGVWGAEGRRTAACVHMPTKYAP